jgi:hypothetical protein
MYCPELKEISLINALVSRGYKIKKYKYIINIKFIFGF